MIELTYKDLRLPNKLAWQDSEDALQMKCAEATKKMLKRKGFSQKLFYHVPNGGRREQREASRLKMMGVQAGVSDVHVMVRTPKWAGWIVELKKADGYPSEDQKEYMTAMRQQGFRVLVINDLDTYLKQLRIYFKPFPDV